MTLGSFCTEAGAECCFHAQEVLAAVLQTNGYCERGVLRCIATKMRGNEAVLSLIEASPRSAEIRRLVELSGNGTGLLNGMNYGPSVSFIPESCTFVGLERAFEIKPKRDIGKCVQVQYLPAPPERLPMVPGGGYLAYADALVDSQGRVEATGWDSVWSSEGDDRTYVVVGAFLYGIRFDVPETGKEFDRTVATISFGRERTENGTESCCLQEECADQMRTWQWVGGAEGDRWRAGPWSPFTSDNSRCPVDLDPSKASGDASTPKDEVRPGKE